jgi:hypothetical protein
VRLCTLATFGDAGIALGAFWGVAWCCGERGWPRHPTALVFAFGADIKTAGTGILLRPSRCGENTCHGLLLRLP